MATRKAKKPTTATLWAVTTLALIAKKTRNLLATHSFVFFCWYYLGVKLALHQEFWAHKLLRSKRHLVLGPRGHGKSELVGKLIPLWLICRDRNVRILIVTATGGSKGLARKHVMLIRHELEANEKLIADFGQFYDIKRCQIWQQEIFQVIRDKTMKDATLEAVGVFGSVTGGRFDYILIDDLIDLKKVNTPELIEKIQQEVTSTILPLLTPEGRAWAIGTRKNFSDIYGWMVKNPTWTASIDKAIIREPDGWRLEQLDEPILFTSPEGDIYEEHHRIVFANDDRGECLWSEMWPMDKLLLAKVNLGTPVFSREYQNEVVDDATALFRLSWLQQCRDQSLSYATGPIPQDVRNRFEVIMVGVDPSLVTDKREAAKTDSDYMVQICLGIDKRGDRYLLALDRDRGLSPSQVETRIAAFYNRTNPFRCAVESNSFGVLHIHNLVDNKGLKVRKHHTGANKHDPYEGTPHLSALFEAGKFHLPYQTEEDRNITDSLIGELHAFGSDIHDDQVMALWITEYTILKWLVWKANQRRMREGVTA